MTLIFITALSRITKLWKDPNCPLTDEWIKKMGVHIHVHAHARWNVKRNEILPFVTTWMDLEGIMLSGISQPEKDKYHMLPLIWGV